MSKDANAPYWEGVLNLVSRAQYGKWIGAEDRRELEGYYKNFMAGAFVKESRDQSIAIARVNAIMEGAHDRMATAMAEVDEVRFCSTQTSLSAPVLNLLYPCFQSET